MTDVRGTVMIIGVLDQQGSTNIPMALSMIKHNFNIIPVNYRTIIKRYGYVFFTQLVLQLVVSQKPDLVIVCKGNGIMPDLIAEITRHTRTWVYNMDPQATIDMCPEVMENARIATFSSCTAMDMAEEWTKMGANCFYMVQGLDTEIFKPVEPVKKYSADISFIGSKNPLRDEAKEYLENAGYNIKFYGPGYGKTVVDKEFAKVCASSKYMLSIDSMTGQHKHYFSNRLIRLLGCGACTFHHDALGTLNDQFRHEEDLIYFRTLPELVGAIRTLEHNPQRAGQIAMNGLAKVQNEYTWDRKITELLMTALPELMGVENGPSPS